jgi:hypothetical protein
MTIRRKSWHIKKLADHLEMDGTLLDAGSE